MHGTQNIRRLRQYAMPPDQTQDPILLMKILSPRRFFFSFSFFGIMRSLFLGTKSLMQR